jgi:hypothetical protein
MGREGEISQSLRRGSAQGSLMPQSIKNRRLRFFLATLSHARLFWSLVD